MSTPKQDRQATILEVVNAHVVDSQEELRRLLRQRGWDVTQATLSRDLRDLRLARVPTPDGTRYLVSTEPGGDPESNPVLDRLLPELLLDVDGVSELLVLKTTRGGASALAEAFDLEAWPDVVGSVAGDDTILVVCRSSAARERLGRRIRQLSGADGA